MKRSPTLLLLYVLMAYVVVQFLWWAFLLYDLNAEVLSLKSQLNADDALTLNSELKKKTWMILGEGTVFLSLLIVGAFYIRKFIRREQALAKQERNFLLATTHELNSPLASVRLNFQTLQRTDLNETQKSTLVSSGLESVNRLDALVANILAASRMDAGKFELHLQQEPLKLMCERAVGRFSTLAASLGSTFSIEIGEQVHVFCDRAAFEIVLSNLIQNALKYAPGTLIRIKSAEKEKSVLLYFSDGGKGIERAEMKHVFKKFYRIENEETRSQKGTGLGLYIVKELVALHGGTISLMDEQGRGLMFLIELPK